MCSMYVACMLHVGDVCGSAGVGIRRMLHVADVSCCAHALTVACPMQYAHRHGCLLSLDAGAITRRVRQPSFDISNEACSTHELGMSAHTHAAGTSDEKT